jgi:thioesterase domain-containing protein
MVKSQDRSLDSTSELVTSDKLSTSIVPLRAAGRRPPLFCVHDGLFGDLSGVLQTDRAVYAVGYHCSNEMKSSLTIECLATNHLAELAKVQPHGPYYLIGYSLGALVAYEMATLLTTRGEDVNLLALIDIYNPALFHDPTSEAVQFRKSYRADRARKYLTNFMRGEFYKLAVDASKLFRGKARAIARAMVGVRPTIVFTWLPKKFPGRMVLYRVKTAMDGGSEFDHDPTLGWSNYAQGGVDVKYVEGEHGTVMQMPQVIDLAAKLAPYLNSADH